MKKTNTQYYCDICNKQYQYESEHRWIQTGGNLGFLHDYVEVCRNCHDKVIAFVTTLKVDKC